VHAGLIELSAIDAAARAELCHVAARHSWQRAVVTELVGAVLDGAPGTLDPSLVPAWRHAADDAGRLRVAIDQVAQLTDTSAVAWHARLVRPDRT
jgi:dGTPase